MVQFSRYELGLCQRFNQEIHGFDPNTSSPNIKDHYICLITIESSFSTLYYTALYMATRYCATIEIVETHVLVPGNEMVAIYKTFWLRIFQRLVRKWLVNRRYARSAQLYTYLMKREYPKIHQ
jgi:hypothetical protein